MLYLRGAEPRPVPATILEMVNDVFCDPDRARYGPYELVGEGTEVLADTLYEFPVVDLNDWKGYYLQLFTRVKGVGGQIWDQEIRTMMRISRLGHPGLPEVIAGGYEATEEGAGRDDFAYVVTPRPQARLNEWGEMERLRNDRSEALWQFGMLTDALARLHWHGVTHRNLWPGTIERYTLLGGIRTSALRLIRFEMSSFIENAFRRFSTPEESAEAYAAREDVRRFIIAEGVNALACCAPERLRLLAAQADADPEATAETPQADVYSLAVVACQWFADKERPDENLMAKAFGGVNIDLGAAEEFRKSLVGSLRGTKKLHKDLRRLIERMLEPDWLDRPTAQKVREELSKNFEDWSAVWSDSDQTQPRLVGYLPEETGRNVYAWNWVTHEPTDAIGMRQVNEFIMDDLRDGSLVYSPEGFTPFAEGLVTDRMKVARHVLLGARAAWFCQLYNSNETGNLEHWKEVLLIKYVVRRDGARGHKVGDLYKSLFKHKVGAIEVLPATPATHWMLNMRRRGRPEWTRLLSDVESRTPKQEGQLEFERALEFLLNFFRIELEARVYPFTKVSDDGSVVRLRVDEELDDQRRQNADTALLAFFLNRTDPPRPYFGDFFTSSQTYDDETDWVVDCYADRGGRREAKPLGKALVIDEPETFEVKLRPTDKFVVPEKGWLAPAKDRSRRTELDRQVEAVQELYEIGSLIGQIRDPQTIRTLRGPWEGAGGDLYDGDEEVAGAHGQHFVQELLRCHPFYALHGPPGTGKTTVVSEAVAALLRREPTARVLISAQSNFALDNLGERLASLMKESGTVLRVTSEGGASKVTEPMKQCLLGPLTSRVEAEIRTNCEAAALDLAKSGHHEFAKLSREWLESLRGSLPDLQERIRTGANVVLATCSGSSKFHIDRASGSSLFDWVIVEEAARAWPTEIAIPLVRGFRWALVGDHKQLPAHRIREIEKFLELCEQSQNVAEIKRHGLDRARYMKIYKFFGELFEKLEQQAAEAGETRGPAGGPPLGRMRKQFRMRKPIADVISEAFYKKPPLLTSPKTETDERPHFNKPGCLADGKPLVWIDTSDMGYDDERCWKNRAEAAIIYDLLLMMEPLPRASRDGYSKHPLAILSPYRQQNELIDQYVRGNVPRNRVEAGVARRLEVAKLARPDVIHSVHSIQGREADVVIASLVRSGGQGPTAHARLGHVADQTLINVLFSRPRKLLVVVGDLSFFEDCAGRFKAVAGFWGDVCGAVRRHARVIPSESLYERLS